MSELNPANPRGAIFNIQRFSIHDGPGIRTTVFLKGCPLRCFWCQNPESQDTKPEVLFNRDKCTSCGACVKACLAEANRLTPDGLQMDRDRCVGCGACVAACPNEARKLAGQTITADEVMEEVLRDKPFYENSGGGVTISGGEPLMQPDFALEILRRSKAEGLHTAVDTCGCAPTRALERVLDYADLFLFDIKCLDSGRHQEGTGRGNELILANARRIVEASKEMWVRVPLIPGFNDSENDITDLARFVTRELGLFKIDLHPYNKLSESKYGHLDKKGVRLETQSDEYIQRLRDIVSAECS